MRKKLSFIRIICDLSYVKRIDECFIPAHMLSVSTLNVVVGWCVSLPHTKKEKFTILLAFGLAARNVKSMKIDLPKMAFCLSPYIRMQTITVTRSYLYCALIIYSTCESRMSTEQCWWRDNANNTICVVVEWMDGCMHALIDRVVLELVGRYE